MKPLFYKGWFVSVALVIGTSQLKADSPDIIVQVQAKTEQWLAYSEPPRLTQVLSQVDDVSDLYWPAATLFAMNHADIENKRDSVLLQLQRLEQHWQQQNQAAYVVHLQNLRQQMAEWQLAYRVPVAVDYDLARIRPEHNPKLDPGQYRLILPTRSEHIRVVGQLPYERLLAHRGASSVRSYLEELSLRDHNASWVFVIQVDGQLDKVGVAYWNKQRYELKPGSQLFIPMADAMLPREFRSLNQDIAELLVHRMLP
ncbi:MAG: capsule biosynthesis GfcC family protein [Alkalimonas sp.]|nr:capsule biosynthesis GfcC family protein [Alkalimonas sp.]